MFHHLIIVIISHRHKRNEKKQIFHFIFLLFPFCQIMIFFIIFIILKQKMLRLSLFDTYILLLDFFFFQILGVIIYYRTRLVVFTSGVCFWYFLFLCFPAFIDVVILLRMLYIVAKFDLLFFSLSFCWIYRIVIFSSWSQLK